MRGVARHDHGRLAGVEAELLRREPTDERLDIFSYGVMAFELLTGRLPYDAAPNSLAVMLQRINQEPLDPAKANPQLPAEVCDLLRKLTARRKNERWPKLATLPDVLRDLAEAQPAHAVRSKSV